MRTGRIPQKIIETSVSLLISFPSYFFLVVSTYFLAHATSIAVGHSSGAVGVLHPHFIQPSYLHTTSLRNMSLHSSQPAKKSASIDHTIPILGDDKPLQFVRRGSLNPADLYAPMYQASSDPASAASGAYPVHCYVLFFSLFAHVHHRTSFDGSTRGQVLRSH
jgi:hypothetical protein